MSLCDKWLCKVLVFVWISVPVVVAVVLTPDCTFNQFQSDFIFTFHSIFPWFPCPVVPETIQINPTYWVFFCVWIEYLQQLKVYGLIRTIILMFWIFWIWGRNEKKLKEWKEWKTNQNIKCTPQSWTTFFYHPFINRYDKFLIRAPLGTFHSFICLGSCFLGFYRGVRGKNKCVAIWPMVLGLDLLAGFSKPRFLALHQSRWNLRV